jgi:hypothetical protein
MANNDDREEPDCETPGLSKEAADGIKREVLFGVGYGRPPEHTRFKKGQSGNPKGRPKRQDAGLSGSPILRELILKENERLVTIREGDELGHMSTFELTLRAETKSAVSGNAYAQKHKIERHFWADRERRAEIEESNASWRRYVAWHREQIAEAERKGEPPPALLPHPDDVIIDDETGVRLIGPVNRAELAKLEETIKVRDILIIQDALDHCLTGDPDGDDQPGTALLFAMLLDKSVPARFRLSETDWSLRMMRYDRMPKRALLKAVYGAWKALGRRVPRGRTLPPLRWGEPASATVLDMASIIQSGDNNITDHVNVLNALLKEGTGCKATT